MFRCVNEVSLRSALLISSLRVQWVLPLCGMSLLMWLTWAFLLLSLQAGISQWLRLLCLVLNSTYLKRPTSIHRQLGSDNWQEPAQWVQQE